METVSQVPSNQTKNNIDTIERSIKDFKARAEGLARIIREVEAERRQMIHLIEEAEYTGVINRRTAWRLEEKLVRPYAMDLLNL